MVLRLTSTQWALQRWHCRCCHNWILHIHTLFTIISGAKKTILPCCRKAHTFKLCYTFEFAPRRDSLRTPQLRVSFTPTYPFTSWIRCKKNISALLQNSTAVYTVLPNLIASRHRWCLNSSAQSELCKGDTTFAVTTKFSPKCPFQSNLWCESTLLQYCTQAPMSEMCSTT